MNIEIKQDFCLRMVYKKQGNGVAKEEDHHIGKDGVACPQNGTVPDPFLNPVQLPCSQILASVGGHSGAHGIKRAAEKHADLAGRRHGCHRCRSQGVYGSLKDHAADGCDRILQPHGNPHIAQGLHDPDIRLPLLPLHLQYGIVLFHVEKA